MNVNAFLLPLGVFLFLACMRLPAPGTVGHDGGGGVMPVSKGVDQQLKVAVGGSGGGAGAVLAVWVIEPAAGTSIRGTVIFLHGFMTSHHTVANAGEALRRAGYRAVLVDMRGFGESTGMNTDFGVTAARDMRQLVDYLQQKDLCGERVGVYGTSLGAATAILFAAEDSRVATVVAVAPFADLRTEVPSFARGVLGKLGDLVPEKNLSKAADVVGAVARWDMDQARPIDAIQKTRASVLLIHGDADTFIPHAASEQLHAAAADHSELVTMHDRGHLDVCFDIPGELRVMTREWFDRKLMGR